MDKIVPAFEISLFDETLSSACIEMSELGIDSLLDDGIFKSIPIVNVLVGVGKTAQNIYDRNLLRQTIKFINTFNEHKIPLKKLEKHREKLNSNPKFAEEELGRVIIALNSNVEIQKSVLLAKFYRAYINEQISWNQYCEFSEINSRLFISDLELLYAIDRKEITDTSCCQVYQAERLISLGLLDSAMKSMSIGSNTSSHTERYVNTNPLGNLFCQITLSK